MLIFFDIETIGDSSLLVYEKYRERHSERVSFAPECNKIFTITLGYKNREGIIVLKSLEGEESVQIQEFFGYIDKSTICGFNIRNFDIPFILKRALLLKIPIPDSLKTYGKKPWEMGNVIDLLEVYECGVFGAVGNLDIICNFLGITSPKESGIDGSLVQSFYDEGKEQEILEYCKRDTEATIHLYDYFKEYNFI